MVEHIITVKPVLSSHSKIDKTKVLKPCGTLMQVKVGAFCTILMVEHIVTVKPVLSSYSEIDKTKVLKPCGTLMQVKSTAECSMAAFCNTFDLH